MTGAVSLRGIRVLMTLFTVARQGAPPARHGPFRTSQGPRQTYLSILVVMRSKGKDLC